MTSVTRAEHSAWPSNALTQARSTAANSPVEFILCRRAIYDRAATTNRELFLREQNSYRTSIFRTLTFSANCAIEGEENLGFGQTIGQMRRKRSLTALAPGDFNWPNIQLEMLDGHEIGEYDSTRISGITYYGTCCERGNLHSCLHSFNGEFVHTNTVTLLDSRNQNFVRNRSFPIKPLNAKHVLKIPPYEIEFHRITHQPSERTKTIKPSSEILWEPSSPYHFKSARDQRNFCERRETKIVHFRVSTWATEKARPR